MGMREFYHNTKELIFSAPGIVTRQMMAVWTSGVILALLISFGAGLHYTTVGDWSGLAGLGIAVLFVPSFALVSGIWSKGSKLFEAAFAIWWYIGPLNRIPELDFTGGSSTAGVRCVYLAMAILFLVLCYIGRKKEDIA
jgi:hypothetical protein